MKKLILIITFFIFYNSYSQGKDYNIYIEYEKNDEIRINNDTINVIYFKYKIKNLNNIKFSFIKEKNGNERILIQGIDEYFFNLVFDNGKKGKISNVDCSNKIKVYDGDKIDTVEISINRIQVPDLYYFNFEALNSLLTEAKNIFLIDMRNCNNGECDFYKVKYEIISRL